MKRDWNKLNLTDAYKPVPQSFEQTIAKTIRGLKNDASGQKTDHSGFLPHGWRMAIAAALSVLLISMAVAYAVSRPAVLNWLLGYEQAGDSLVESTQTVAGENSADHITARINSVVYEGDQFVFSYELENGRPDQPAMVAVDNYSLVNGKELGLNLSAYDLRLVPDPRQDVLPVRRNPADGGAWSLPIRQALTGEVTCEVTFIVYRPIKGFAVVSDPEDPICHLDGYDEETQAEIQDKWNTLRGFQNTLIVDSNDGDPERWAQQGYTVLDSDGNAYLSESELGKTWDEAPLYNLRETARIPVRFTFNTNSAIVYDFSDIGSVALDDCVLRIHRLRFSPLTSIVDISLIPRENTQEAAQELVERYGVMDLADERGEPLTYSSMDYEFSPKPWATERWRDNDHWACTYRIEMPGLQAWPERISLMTAQGELLSLSISASDE